MTKRTRKSNPTTDPRSAGQRLESPVGLRIVGGRFRGRRLQYGGDIRTRPMKDRLREAVFNLLGPDIRGTHAIDLFAGTGALAFEALSRGAARATLIEQHYPTADIIRRNAVVLEVEDAVDIVTGNVFIWWKKKLGCHAQPDMPTASVGMAPAPADTPWAVFCSPPYDFYVQRTEEMLELIGGLIQAAPAGSAFVVEADERFDFGRLPDPQAWDVRSYPPAVVGICWKS
jgi:16S rRNA (guanine966-N2)-methyltransferase